MFLPVAATAPRLLLHPGLASAAAVAGQRHFAASSGASVPTPEGVDPGGGWQAELDLELRRRRELQERGRSPKRGPGQSPGPPEGGAGGPSPEGPSPEQREEVQRGVAQLELFAYPTNRRTPWATAALVAASGCLTAAAALHWQLRVCGSPSLEELRPRAASFAGALEGCSVGQGDVERGEVHRLLLASLLRAGVQPSRILTDIVVLGCCGTLLERLQGPGFVLSLVLGSTVLTNLGASVANGRMVTAALANKGIDQANGDASVSAPMPCLARVSSTSGGVTALGVFCALRHGRWAAWPGLPLPVAWLMAPVFVATLSAFLGYGGQLREYKAAAEAAAEVAATASIEGRTASSSIAADVSGLDVVVSLAACEAVEGRARAACQAPPEDVVAWREELQEAVDRLPPQPPDGAFFADLCGAAVGVVAAIVLRRRVV
mmetsp:Transcript_56688/g.184485  ORF Transcript_56688/g.184485 Transcript_56688/m.184485 type:complete len:434 (-) Transcript_56688:89-1390(-)